mgnify:CR=1 FL=1
MLFGRMGKALLLIVGTMLVGTVGFKIIGIFRG